MDNTRMDAIARSVSIILDRRPRRVALAVIFSGLCAVLQIGVARSFELHTEARHFQVRLAGIAATEPLNRLHGFELTVLTRAGEPVAGANVTVSAERLLTSNPLPTIPRVNAAPAPGGYHGEGLRFHIPGAWRLAFDIEWKEIRDRATVDFMVK